MRGMDTKSPTSKSKILALIPAYNEEPRVVAVIASVRKYLPVLVVDDGSTDKTTVVAQAAGAIVVPQMPNQGKGAALRTGFRYALEQDYTAAVTLDADGQHDPDEIPSFLQVFSDPSPDLIIGQRDFKQMPLVRRVSNTLGRSMFSWAMGQPIADNQSGYRLISRRLMEALLDSQERGFEFEVEMIQVCIQRGYHLAWTPIRTIYTGQGSHIQPLKHLVHYFRVVWQTRRRMRSSR